MGTFQRTSSFPLTIFIYLFLTMIHPRHLLPRTTIGISFGRYLLGCVILRDIHTIYGRVCNMYVCSSSTRFATIYLAQLDMPNIAHHVLDTLYYHTYSLIIILRTHISNPSSSFIKDEMEAG